MNQPATPKPDAADPSTPDPSMEDILASIRLILSEGEAEAKSPGAAAGQPPTQPMHDVLLLNEDMMVPDPVAVPTPTPAPIPATIRVVPDQPQQLVAPEAAQAAATSVGALVRTIAQERSVAVHRGGPTIEDMVREEIRPILKEWLDVNLPPMVERLVRAEIERVVGRASS